MKRHGSLALILPASIAGLLLTAVIPLTAFEAHVINVTAKIDPGDQCHSEIIQPMSWWKTHPEFWTLPQTLGNEIIDTPAKATTVFNQYQTTQRNPVRGQLLALKFNIAHFHIGLALVQYENITINQLAVEADNLLKQNPAPSQHEYFIMRGRLSGTNQAGHCLVCEPRCPTPGSNTNSGQCH